MLEKYDFSGVDPAVATELYQFSSPRMAGRGEPRIEIKFGNENKEGGGSGLGDRA